MTPPEMKHLPIVLALTVFLAVPVRAQYEPSDAEIAAAKLPLPAELREGAGVIHWNWIGQIQQLRPSTNGMSCNIDNPDNPVVDIRCYHDDFWTVIARSWKYSREVETPAERDSLLANDFASGALVLPEQPTAGYRILDLKSGTISAAGPWSPTARKWQSVHFPFCTAEEMGLPTGNETNLDGMPGQVPYVMASGSWWSHVMIVHQPFDN